MLKNQRRWFQVGFILFALLLITANAVPSSGQADPNDLFLPVAFRARAQYWIEDLKPAVSARDIAPFQEGYLFAATSSQNSFTPLLMKLQTDGQVSWHRELSSSTISAIQSAGDTITLAGATFAFGAGDYDVLLMQLDAHGNILWQKTIGGSELDAAHAVQHSSDGGFLAAGATRSFESGSLDSDLWLIKFTDTGAISWQKTYGDNTTEERGNDILSTSDGGYLITGSKGLAGWLLKIDATGNVAWEKSVGQGGPSSMDELVAAQQTADGGFLVAGQLKDMNYWTAVLLKVDANGNLKNSIFFGHPAEFFDLKATPDGNFMAAGNSAGHAWIVKVDGSGQPLWQRTYGAGGESGKRLVVSADGSFALAGTHCTNLINGCAAWVLHLDSSGAIPNCSWLSSLIVSQVNWSVSLEDTNVAVVPTNVAAADSGVTIQSSSFTEMVICPDSARSACLEVNK